MTKLRDPASIEHAVLKCLGALGRQVEEITGKSERYIRMCSDPDEDRHIQVRDALALDAEMRRIGAGQPILDAYLALLGETPSGRAGACPRAAFLDVAVEVGELAKAVADAMADGMIDLAERRAITAVAHRLIDDVRLLVEAIEPPYAVPIAGGRQRT
jgi:hypothetical protein